MEKSIALCPFCDQEQRVGNGKPVVRCQGCGRAFNIDQSRDNHPEEFWSNPDNCARF